LIAELRTHRLVELGELGVVTSEFSTMTRDARAHRGRRVLRSLPQSKMRIQHDPTAALSGLLAQKQSLCRRRVTVELKNIVRKI